jgi:hypothetical protein
MTEITKQRINEMSDGKKYEINMTVKLVDEYFVNVEGDPYTKKCIEIEFEGKKTARPFESEMISELYMIDILLDEAEVSDQARPAAREYVLGISDCAFTVYEVNQYLLAFGEGYSAGQNESGNN